MASDFGKLLVVGAGGHGKAVADAAERMELWRKIVFIDKKYPGLSENGQWPVIGGQDDLREYRQEFSSVAVAVGNARTRLILLDELKLHGFELPVIRHPSSVVAADVVLGEGSVVLAGVIINSGVKIGRGCIVNTGAIVDHDCILSSGVHVCPGVSMAGEVVVGALSWIGIGAVVMQQRKIGEQTTVGAGAVVIRDVPDNVTVVGVPAKVLSKSSVCDESKS